MGTSETSTGPPEGRGSETAGLARPLILAVSCLVLGFVGGWTLRGGEKDPVVLPPVEGATAPPAAPPPSPQVTRTEPPPPPPAPPVERSAVVLAVLNGSGATGLAGEAADRATSAGYPEVSAGNAPIQSGPSIVYFRPGARAAAQLVSDDLGVGRVQALPADTGFVSEAPAQAQVILVIGPG